MSESENAPQLEGPKVPSWLVGIASMLFGAELEAALAKPDKLMESHFKLAAQGMGIA